MKNRTRVSLLIYDYDKDFLNLSKSLGIEPTKLIEKSELKPNHPRVWELVSDISESEELEKHLEDMVRRLRHCKKQLTEVSKQYRCVISVGLNYNEYNPEIALDNQLLQSLADLGIKLWMDIYCDWYGKSDASAYNGISKL